MTRRSLSFALSAALMTCAGVLLAQQPDDRTYLTVLSLKTHPGKETALIENYRTGIAAKAIRARMAANPNRLRWTLLRAVFPGDPAPEANFLIAMVDKGARSEPDSAKREELTRSATGLTYSEYMDKARSLSELLGTSIAHVHDVTDGYSVAQGDYVVLSRLKTTPGLAEMHSTVTLRLANDRVKEGRLKGWSYSHLYFPSGSSLPWNATEASVYKDIASAMPARNTGVTAEQRFLKLLPGSSYTAYSEALRSARTIVRTDLYRVEAVFQR